MPHRQIQLTSLPGLWPLTWPMGLTMLRLVLLPLFLYVLLMDKDQANHSHRWLAVGIFMVMAITDKLDGYLARRFNQVSKLGTILDPVADKLLVACSMILLSFDWIAAPPYAIPMAVVVAVYGKDLIVAMGTVALLAVAGRVTIAPRPLGKLSTFLQLSLVIATLIAPDLRHLNEALPAVFLRVLWWGVSIIAAASCTDYLWQGMWQFRQSRASQAS